MEIRVRCKIVDDNWRAIESRLIFGASQVRHDTGRAIKDAAFRRAPRDTGYMASSIEDDGDGVVMVGAHYAPFVNFGTRWMHAQPFFSESCAIEGVNTMAVGLAAILGPGTIVFPVDVVTDRPPFLTGPLKGVPHTFPFTPAERRKVAAYLHATGQ